MTIEITIGIIGIIFSIILLLIGVSEYGPPTMFPGMMLLMLSIIAIVSTTQGNCECTHNHNCEHQITYTYQCKLCDEIVKQTEEPKIKLCDECIATIKEIESQED